MKGRPTAPRNSKVFEIVGTRMKDFCKSKLWGLFSWKKGGSLENIARIRDGNRIS